MKRLSFFALLVVALLFVQCNSDKTTIDNIDQNRIATKVENTEEAVALQTGNYGDLLIAFDGNQITGFYNLMTGGGNFGCTFYFYGKTKGKKGEVPIQWYYPGEKERKKGKLIIDNGEIKIKVTGNPGGQCMPELMNEGETIRLTNQNNWKSIRVVKTKKSTIYEEADDAMDTDMAFAKGEIICVLEEKGGWLRAELAGGEKVGWIKTNDLEALK